MITKKDNWKIFFVFLVAALTIVVLSNPSGIVDGFIDALF